MGLESSGADDIRKALERLANDLPDAVRGAIDESLEEGKDHSIDVVHVVTGRLRDSIRTENVTEEGGDLVAGGIDGVDYAAVEELGNSKREGHPFLRPGFEISQRALSENVKKKIDDLL